MATDEIAIFSQRVVTDAGTTLQPGSVGPATVIAQAGRITHVIPGDAARRYATLDVGNLALLPGLVDTHVHVNEPGRTDWEGFRTAGRAAAAGGIITIVVMPLNCSPAATNVAALEGEIDAAAGVCLVDYGFWGGIVPGNGDDVEPMAQAGALGFKAFMVDSGVDDFRATTEGDLRWLTYHVEGARQKLGPILVHAEDPALIIAAGEFARASLIHNPRSYMAYLASRPAEAETEAVRKLAPLCDSASIKAPLAIHVVHVASRGALAILEESKRRGLSMSAETCPHYLTFAAEDIPDGATTFKCAPPIRAAAVRDALWDALRSGVLSMVASDHSPCPPEMKLLEEGDFARAWGGISSLQVSLAATWTGAHARGFTLTDIVRWMCENPAKLAGVHNQKGRIAPSFDADLIVFDPDAEWIVRGADLEHRHKLTPYDGLTLRGVVHRTILRGETIFERREGANHFAEPRGQWLRRNPPTRTQA